MDIIYIYIVPRARAAAAAAQEIYMLEAAQTNRGPVKQR
jgi:hypothetical protein